MDRLDKQKIRKIIKSKQPKESVADYLRSIGARGKTPSSLSQRINHHYCSLTRLRNTHPCSLLVWSWGNCEDHGQ